jgi:hypothetical protein
MSEETETVLHQLKPSRTADLSQQYLAASPGGSTIGMISIPIGNLDTLGSISITEQYQ